jgi:N-dimethylarginine dimethylaminohydrolase
MCPPTFFDVTYYINPWMSKDNPPVCSQTASTQWMRLATEISRIANVEVLTPKGGLPDLCFTANAGLIVENTFVASRFRHPQRQSEVREFSEWFSARGYGCVTLDDSIVFEGAGDALFDKKGRLWFGYGPRSEFRAATALSRKFDLEVIPLRLADPQFYHLDTCFALLEGDFVVYFPQAFTPDAKRLIEDVIPESRRIDVTSQDAARMGCNMVVLGEEVFMNQGTEQLAPRLRALGLQVHELELSEFMKSGGSAKCLTFPFERTVS